MNYTITNVECGVPPILLSREKGACFTMTPSIALPSLYREALSFFASGKSTETVLNYLVQKGLPERYARTLMAAAQTESRTMAAAG
jgi:hypothetical protein